MNCEELRDFGLFVDAVFQCCLGMIHARITNGTRIIGIFSFEVNAWIVTKCMSTTMSKPVSLDMTYAAGFATLALPYVNYASRSYCRHGEAWYLVPYD